MREPNGEIGGNEAASFAVIRTDDGERFVFAVGIEPAQHELAAQRAQLGLAECGEQNSAWFGLQRMLLAYAAGSLDDAPEASAGWQGIEPYTEVGGLDAALAGSLAHLLGTLQEWWQRSQQQAGPQQPGTHGALADILTVPGKKVHQSSPFLAVLRVQALSHSSCQVSSVRASSVSPLARRWG